MIDQEYGEHCAHCDNNGFYWFQEDWDDGEYRPCPYCFEGSHLTDLWFNHYIRPRYETPTE